MYLPLYVPTSLSLSKVEMTICLSIFLSLPLFRLPSLLSLSVLRDALFSTYLSRSHTFNIVSTQPFIQL